jgi:hypothetical protein
MTTKALTVANALRCLGDTVRGVKPYLLRQAVVAWRGPACLQPCLAAMAAILHLNSTRYVMIIIFSISIYIYIPASS